MQLSTAPQDSGTTAPYIYDELRYGAVPTKEAAAKILDDMKTGKAMPHPVCDLGWKSRLEQILAGQPVEQTYWLRT